MLKERDVLDSKVVHRVVFHEVTKRAIQEAIGQPRKLSEELVNAQQARRALDYLVGFNLSPLLWKKVRRGLSAGRVQSPALRLIVEREDEITAFKAQEYWTIEALAESAQPDAASTQFPARLRCSAATRSSSSRSRTRASVRAAEQKIRDTARGKLTVAKVDKKQRRRNPAAPFTTSTLQQEASRKLGFSAQRTMTVAQRLYEGVDIGEGTVGLITYMRTDSVTLAEEALRELRCVIADRYGKDNLPDEPRRYTTKAKNAQEAHEAIRPTSASRAPEDVRRYLDAESVQALRADLEAHGRVADESGRLRHGRARSRRGRIDDGRHRVPRDGLRAREPRLHRRLSGRPRRHGAGRAGPHPARRRRGRSARAAGTSRARSTSPSRRRATRKPRS